MMDHDGPDIPAVYPDGLPLAWQDEQSGRLAEAMRAYVHVALGRPGPNPEQLRLICAFLRYYVNAPAWRIAQPDADNSPLDALIALAERAATFDDVQAVLDAALDLGMDPL